MLIGGSIYQSLVMNKKGIGIEGDFGLKDNIWGCGLSCYRDRKHWKFGNVQ